MLTWVTGRKLPRSTRIGFLYSTSDGWSTVAVGREHGRVAQPELHQLQAHHPVIDVPEGDARELDHVDLEPLDAEVVEQRFEELVRLVVEEERAVEQVHADDAQRLLLQRVSGSSMRTWMMIWLAWSRGWAWNLTPIQPWHSLVPLKLRADTVSAKAKNAVVSPRLRASWLRLSSELVVEHASSRCRQT